MHTVHLRIAAASTWLSVALAHAAPVTLTSQQIQSLGIQTTAVVAETQAQQPFPAQLNLPPDAMAVVASPWSATVLSVQATAGQAVKAGQALMQLRSTDGLAARNDLQQARLQQQLDQRSLARDEQLHAEGLIALSRLDSARHQAQQSQTLHQALERGLNTPEVRWQADGRLVVLAPRAGWLTEVPVLPGQRVEAGTPLLTVARTDRLVVDVAVPLAQAGALRVGDALTVQPSATEQASAQQRTTGRVVAMAPTLTPGTQTVRVRGEIPNTQGQRRAGQWVEVSLGQAVGAQKVPATAVLPGQNGTAQVFEAWPNGRFEARAVKVLGRDGSSALVQGLRPDARVVSQGTVALKALLER